MRFEGPHLRSHGRPGLDPKLPEKPREMLGQKWMAANAKRFQPTFSFVHDGIVRRNRGSHKSRVNLCVSTSGDANPRQRDTLFQAVSSLEYL